MKHTKTLLCLLLALAMLLCAGCKNTDGVQSTSEPAPESSAPETSAPTEETVAPTEGEAVSYQMGDKIQDFTVTTFDGKTVTLSEVLKEKDMVLINIWATWCGPCRTEIPHLKKLEEALKSMSKKDMMYSFYSQHIEMNKRQLLQLNAKEITNGKYRYEGQDTSRVIATIVNCRMTSLVNPVLKAKQTKEGSFLLSPDEVVCFGQLK